MIRVYDKAGNVIETHERAGPVQSVIVDFTTAKFLVFCRISGIGFGHFYFHLSPLRQIKNIRRLIRGALLALVVILSPLNANADFTFTPGHLYSTYNEFASIPNIYEYSETGMFLASLTPPSLIEGDELRGIAFGPDGFLYAVKAHCAESGFNILVLDPSESTAETQSKPRNLREIAKQLGVANILEGSVQKAADQVRVNVQLVNAQTDSHLWADTYDRKLAR